MWKVGGLKIETAASRRIILPEWHRTWWKSFCRILFRRMYPSQISNVLVFANISRQKLRHLMTWVGWNAACSNTAFQYTISPSSLHPTLSIENYEMIISENNVVLKDHIATIHISICPQWHIVFISPADSHHDSVMSNEEISFSWNQARHKNLYITNCGHWPLVSRVVLKTSSFFWRSGLFC